MGHYCKGRPLLQTLYGVGGLHAHADVLGQMTVEQPGAGVVHHHLHGLEGPGEEVQHVSAVRTVRLQPHTHTQT